MKLICLAATVALAAAAGCSAGKADINGRDGTGGPDAMVRISAVGNDVRPDQGIAVSVSGGTLEMVTGVAGAFNADRTSWKTTWTLKPGTSYKVTVTAKNLKGKVTTVTSAFRTARAKRNVGIADVTPRPGEKVGVGMPIIVDFTGPVANRANVEKALEVRSDKGDEGAWSWVTDRRVVYRTRKYWHAHQRISFTAHLAGVRADRDTYGVRDLSRTFKIGDSNVTVADAKTHYMTVNHDGTVHKFRISAGKGNLRSTITTSGIHLTREKAPVVTMTATCHGKPGCDDYQEKVHLAVRITIGGEYVHQSVGEYYYLGEQNESHGCIRTSPKGAEYFYDISQRGDIVNVTGTTRAFADEPYADDWKFWTVSWNRWLAGSALR